MTEHATSSSLLHDLVAEADNLARAARVYFDFADSNSAVGRTREEFEASFHLTQHSRQMLRVQLEKYEAMR